MNQTSTIRPEMTVERLLRLWPQTARVFIDKRMACVGCPVAKFETIEEVAAIYEQDPWLLIDAFKQCASAPPPRDSTGRDREQGCDED